MLSANRDLVLPLSTTVKMVLVGTWWVTVMRLVLSRSGWAMLDCRSV